MKSVKIMKSEKLYVNGDVKIISTLSMCNDAWNKSNEGYNRFYFSNGGATWFASPNDFYFRDWADTTTFFYISYSGYVLCKEWLSAKEGYFVDSVNYTGPNSWVVNQNDNYANNVWQLSVGCSYGCKARSFLTPSDIRIKKNIIDIDDDEALQQILTVQPKKYDYIDYVARGKKTVFGFIAQQVAQIIPEAVATETTDFIPNIYKVASYDNDNKIITFDDYTTQDLKIDNKLRICNDKNDTINIIITEIINTTQIKIKLEENETKSLTPEVFVFGTEVNDFHILDKNYIFTLNVCATQDLHRMIMKQNEIISALTSRIEELESRFL